MVFFASKAVWERFLTLDQLKRRGWLLANYCCMHEIRRISWSLANPLWKGKGLWHMLFSLFGCSWVLPFSMKDLLKTWLGSFVSKNREKIWWTTSLCLSWILWQEGNCTYFDGIQYSDQALKDSLICTLFHWTCLHIREGLNPLLDFIGWLCVSVGGCLLCSFVVFLFCWLPLYTSCELGVHPLVFIWCL